MPCRCDDYQESPRVETPDYHQLLCRARSLLAKLYQAYRHHQDLSPQLKSKIEFEIKSLANHKRAEVNVDASAIEVKIAEIDKLKQFSVQCGVTNGAYLDNLDALKSELVAKVTRMRNQSDDELLFG